MDTEKLLSTAFQELGLSENFCKSSESMGFRNLGDVIFLLPENLLNKKGFSYAWLGELSAYLDKHGLLYLLQPLPGKNYG